jgi:glycosyltransferase involved in cell wall biosynthesis
MKILLVSPCFPPMRATAALRTHSFAQSWSEMGQAVTVLTTLKREDQVGWELPRDGFELAEIDYPVPWYLERMRAGYKGETAETPRAGLGRRLMQWFKQKTGIYSAARRPDLTDYWVAPALAWARAHGPWDVVVSSYGPYAAHRVARAIKREKLAPRWVADYRDLWTDSPVYRGLFPFTLLEAHEERACLSEADLIVAVSGGLTARLSARTSTPVEVVYNGFDPEERRTLSPERVLPVDGRRRIVFTGAFYPQGQNPRCFLDALALLEREGSCANRLGVVLAGPALPLWRDLLEPRPLECVELYGNVPREHAMRMQRDADALLLLDWHDPREGVLTSKVFEYLPVAAPIFLVGSPPGSPLAALVRRAGRGVILPTDPRALADWLAFWLDAAGSICNMPDRAFIASLSRPRQARRFLDLLMRVTGQNPSAEGAWRAKSA